MYVTLPGVSTVIVAQKVPPNFMQQESICQKFGQDIAGHAVSSHTLNCQLGWRHLQMTHALTVDAVT